MMRKSLIMLTFLEPGKEPTSNLIKLFLASLIAVLVVPATSLASPSSSPQATPISSADADKQTNAPMKPHQPRPNPDASGKYHVGDGVTPPILVHSVEPEFPKKMRNPNYERYTIALTVGTDGKPTDVHIAPSSSASKNEDNGNLAIETRMICVNAAEQYRFKPAIF